MKKTLKNICRNMGTLVVVLALVLSFSSTAFAANGTWNFGEKVNYVPFNGEATYRPSDWTSSLVSTYQLNWYESPTRQVLKGEFMLVQLRTIQASLERQGYSRLTANGEILNFKDNGTLVPNAQEEAKVLKSLGILSGTPDGYMEMDKPIKRSEAAKVITYANDRILKIPATRNAKTFYDTVGHWAEGSISYAYQIGLLNGISDTYFDPDGPLTLEQTLQILENEVGYYGITREDVAKAMNQTFKVSFKLANSNNGTENITLSKSNITLSVGNSEMVYATITPSSASNKTVTWTTSDNRIATVNSYGLIKAVGNGTTIVTAKTANGYTAFVVVTVNGQNDSTYPTSITITSSVPTMNIGDTYQLSATIKPYNSTNKNVTWSSLDNRIVQIDSNGYIVAVGAGTTVIVARTTNGLEAYTTVVVNGSNNNPNTPTTSTIYVEGYGPSAYYNAFSNEDITFVVQTNQSVSAINFSNDNAAISRNLVSNQSGYTYKVKTASLTQYGETLMTLTLSNDEILSVRICIFQQ